MPEPIVIFVRTVDRVNYFVGRVAMYLFLAMAAVLLYATISRVVAKVPVNWAIEMSQFLLSAYYLLGGAYAVQLNGHVRMDLLYNNLSPRNRALTDAITILFVLFYLIVLLAGGISSTNYAIVYQQTNYSSWAPVLWPIKMVMTVGVLLMLLQLVATFIRDLAVAWGRPIP
jgi:TRAP-type mannitol/chloroaromatic compound transport system permease small subunit